MDFNKDFIFYLLPSNKAFNEYIRDNNVEIYTKKDFEPIVDIALKNIQINESNAYSIKNELKRLLEEENKTEYIEKIDRIYESHMGIRLILDLYNFNFIHRIKKGDEESKVQSTIDLNNLPMKDFYTDKELKKLKKS